MKGSRASLIVVAGLIGCTQALAGPAGERATQAEILQVEGHPAKADSAMREAFALLWEQGPLFLRRSALVSQPAAGPGAVQPRADNVFSRNEPIRLYVEPAGYGFVAVDGGFRVAFRVDAEIVAENGTTIWGRRNLERFGGTSPMRDFSFFETLAFDFEGLPVGRYTIGTTLTDLATQKSVRIDTAIVIE